LISKEKAIELLLEVLIVLSKRWKQVAKGEIEIEFLAILKYHKDPINVVRFSPTKDNCLATASDDGLIILWKRNRSITNNTDPDLEYNKEFWTTTKVFSGPRDGIYDISWSPDSNFIVSGAVDHTIILWDTRDGSEPKVKEWIVHTHYVQGVSWDPLNEYFITQSADKSCQIFQLTETPTPRINIIPNPINLGDQNYVGDAIHSFFRRPCWSPDGSLIFTPCGVIKDTDLNETTFTTFVCGRDNPTKPIIHYPAKTPSVVVKCNPLLFQSLENGSKLFDLPHRIIFCIATLNSISVYDTEHTHPLVIVENPHTMAITDMTWSPDGYVLGVSSQDGYCSFLSFTESEFGRPLQSTQDKLLPKKRTLSEIV
jgi:chromatin assembly factor 1 subunit B